MSNPEHREVALLLLAKARADGVIGFHAQQAVEKVIKAVLADSEVEIPRTHDLGYLLELESPLDRRAALASAETAVAWADQLLASSR